MCVCGCVCVGVNVCGCARARAGASISVDKLADDEFVLEAIKAPLITTNVFVMIIIVN